MLKIMDEEFGFRCFVGNRPAYLDHKLLRSHTAGQSLPLSESLGERIFCLPIHPGMSDEDNEFISASVIEVIERLR
jgi:dTDP-4-amino-4,6-dideoxygalactose transaminase